MPTSRILHVEFLEQAARTPDAPALTFGSRTVTFGELRDDALRVAAGLLDAGIEPGTTVGLHMDRSIDWATSLLAILLADGAVVPLPPSFPEQRRAEIIRWTSLDAVVADTQSRISLPAAVPARVLELGALREAKARTGMGRGSNPEQLAFVLSSSGSTGRPKMIARSHRSFFHRLEWTWETHPFRDGDVGCQKAHFTTTHAVYELFEPLLRGSRGVIVPDPVVRNVERFWEVLEEHRVTRLLIVPSLLRASLETGAFRPPSSLRVVVLMGEYVDRELIRRTVEAFPPHTHLCSIYGSTEASSTLLCDLREAACRGGEAPLGRPLTRDVRPLVLDQSLEPVHTGLRGRLFIAGSSLFSGYLGAPEETARVLRPVPGGDEQAYDTGDDVELSPEGDLLYVGRVDHTVKVRGFRVNTQEVESAIRSVLGVSDVAVVPDQGSAHSTLLLAFVAPSDVSRGDVLEHCRRTLPDYMVPGLVIPLERLPLTASGKANRQRLLAEAGAALHDQATETVPESPTEERVARTWREVLGHGSFNRDTSFFEAGGTSLSVFRLVGALRNEFGVGRHAFGEREVYHSPTVAALARLLDDLQRGIAATVAPHRSLLVRLRAARDPSTPPLFLISSAGGTVGPYARFVDQLEMGGEVIGVQDSYLWGGRDLEEGSAAWVERYLEAVRPYTEGGPCRICAYSSAGAFGLELARRLRSEGAEVETLILVDPLGLDRQERSRFGFWAFRATWKRPIIRALTRAVGRVLHPLAVRLQRGDGGWLSGPGQDWEAATRDRPHIISLSKLLELNTGLPLALEEEHLTDASPEEYLERLFAGASQAIPGLELDWLRRMATQYQVQIAAQVAYRVSGYGGRVLLFEPESPYAGLLAALLRPYLPRLTARVLPLGDPDPRTRALTKGFGALAPHFRSMRDPSFVQALAREVSEALRKDGELPVARRA